MRGQETMARKIHKCKHTSGILACSHLGKEGREGRGGEGRRSGEEGKGQEGSGNEMRLRKI